MEFENKNNRVYFEYYGYDISIVALMSDNKYIVSSGGNDILLWSMQERKKVAILHGHSKCKEFYNHERK